MTNYMSTGFIMRVDIEHTKSEPVAESKSSQLPAAFSIRVDCTGYPRTVVANVRAGSANIYLTDPAVNPSCHFNLFLSPGSHPQHALESFSLLFFDFFCFH